MSLVNDMLRDLEQRNKKDSVTSSPSPIKAAQAAEYQQSQQNMGGLKLLLVLFSLVVIGVTIWLLLSERFLQSPSNTNVNDIQQQVAGNTVTVPQKTEDKTLDIALEEVPDKTVKISDILWSGTEAGGDLVVRLDGAADIQLLGQDRNSVNIAFEDVELEADLPDVSGPLIDRIDVFRDNSRTELMLTTRIESQFAFRVQHSPTTMILGVLPQAVVSSGIKENISQPEVEVVPEPVQKMQKPVTKTTALASAQTVVVDSRPMQPIKKTQRIASDEESVIQARKFVQKGQLAEALRVLEKRIDQNNEGSSSSRGYLATLLLSSGMHQEAQLLLQESLQIHADDFTLRKLQSRLLLSQGNTAESLSLLRQSLPMVKEDPEYHELLATAYQQQGMYEQAAKVYFTLLQHKNNTPRWWVGMAYSLELDKRYGEALRAYRSAVQIPGISASLKTYAEQRLQTLSRR
ncbi:MAG: tetratricopeptide repeat protein [Neptuniibacter sp.]